MGTSADDDEGAGPATTKVLRVPNGVIAAGDPTGEPPEWLDGSTVNSTSELLLINALHEVDGEATITVRGPGSDTPTRTLASTEVYAGQLDLPSGNFVVETVDGLTIATFTGAQKARL